jgi:hypothetical protein
MFHSIQNELSRRSSVYYRYKKKTLKDQPLGYPALRVGPCDSKCHSQYDAGLTPLRIFRYGRSRLDRLRTVSALFPFSTK